MYLLFKNQILINNLRELSINSSKVLNQIRCLTHLNSNQMNSGICLKSNQNNRICLQNVFDLNLSLRLRTFKTTNSQMVCLFQCLSQLKTKQMIIFLPQNPLPENYSSFDLMDGIIARIRRKLGFTSVHKSV